MSTSNQNAGADRKPCRWCSLWNVAFAAKQLEHQPYDPQFESHICGLLSWGRSLASELARRDPGECHGCQKSRLIQQGTHQTPAETAWRAAQWRDNPTVRWMMRPGEHDTFTEAGDET